MMASNASSQMTCQNCSTSITPLWRRDEYGSVLCNACGLFLKLHGRARPISLKTDVIKSRNRVKTMRPDGSGKKKTTAPSHNNQAARRQSTNAHADGTTDSPISRTGTPSMYNNSLQSFVIDDPYASAGVPGFGANGTNGDGSGSPMNGDAPQTHEQLIASNSSLKTRVRELELINELFRGRLSQLEQQEAAARRGHEVAGVEQTQLRNQLEVSQDTENQLRAQLEDSHRRENSLKRRLDELELELTEVKQALDGGSDRPTKKARVGSPEQSTKQEQTSQPDEQAEQRAVETQPEPDMAANTES
ncbi:GATA zinc finger protein 3 [Amphichorda felina]